jgi:excisionase family DNA binding protein
MAKMFYTLEEAAQRLNVSPDEVKRMAGAGKIQQFRDRDKLMFKRDQVDALVSGGKSGSGAPISLATGNETDTFDLGKDQGPGSRKEDPRQATGISVFDADEVAAADPMAQTQFSGHAVREGEELNLESAGSGSGLLDLTRESDDTSLGAELIDDIHAAGASAVGSPSDIAAAASSSGLENLRTTPGMMAQPMQRTDLPGSGLGLGTMLGGLAVLVGLAFVGVAGLMNAPSELARKIAQDDQNLMLWGGGAAVVILLLGVLGWFIGKSRAKSAA